MVRGSGGWKVHLCTASTCVGLLCMAEGKGSLRQEESTASCTCNSWQIPPRMPQSIHGGGALQSPSPLTFHQPLDEATEAVKLQHRSPHSQAQKQVHGLYPQILQAILMSVYSLGPRTLPTVPHSTKRIILTAGSEGNLYNTQ